MDNRNWMLKVPGVSVIANLHDRLVLGDWAKKNIYRNKATSVAMLLVFVLVLGGGVFLSENYAEIPSIWWKSTSNLQSSDSVHSPESVHIPDIGQSVHCSEQDSGQSVHSSEQVPRPDKCKEQWKQRPIGSEPLPRGIVQATSDLEMRPLWHNPNHEKPKNAPENLLAIPVGIRQKESVNQIVKKFPASNFTVMLFHYDGITDQWNDLEWSNRAIHVTAANQTKWWFAKRFLHPDIVASYKYIFLWDEDLGVENFHADRYLEIMEMEGLEISQPGLDLDKSEVHHRITVRSYRSKVHRRIYKFRGHGRCFANSTDPPCTGWVEMMAPVFSRAAWRCAWHMIQNDLVHAWGVDIKLGYCAQGDRTQKVGVIDAEYIVHKGIPSLGGDDIKTGLENHNKAADSTTDSAAQPPESGSRERVEVRRQSYFELDTFKRRWANAVREDKCWTDPYSSSSSKKTVQRFSQPSIKRTHSPRKKANTRTKNN